MTENTPNQPDQVVDGLLLTRDLMFTSKVTGTAAALGFRIETVGGLELLGLRAAAVRPRAVFLDLSCPDFDPCAVLKQLDLQPKPRVIAFGSHVDVERLELARNAGCDDVMPRSKFSATLPDLLRQVFATG